jgi:hypothetical protein
MLLPGYVEFKIMNIMGVVCVLIAGNRMSYNNNKTLQIGHIKRRKPKLRIKILKLVLTKGRISISEDEKILTQHHHPEIWYAFKNLESKDLIRNLKDKNPGPEQLMKRGRWKGYYMITEKGLSALITEGLTTEEFWRSIITFWNNATINNYSL